MVAALFEERQEIILRGPLAFLSGAAFFVIPLFTDMPLALILVMFAAGIGMSYAMNAFMQMHTVVTTSTLSFGPKLWTKRFPLSEVEIVGQEMIPFMAGVGIHRFRGKNYYNMRLGQGLVIRRGKSVFVIGTGRLPEFEMALLTAKREAAR